MTSRHAVDFAVQRSRVIGTALKTLGGQVLIGAIGSATASAAHAAGLRVSYSAHQQSAAGLASELAILLAKKRVLLLRSNLADSRLPESLAKGGATVTDLIAYYTLPPDDATRSRLNSLPWSEVDAAIFFSPSAIDNLATSLGPELMKTVTEVAVSVAIGATTAAAASEAGFTRSVQAEQPALESIIEAVHAGLAASPSRKMSGVNRT